MGPGYAAEISATPVRDDAEIEAAAGALAREPRGGLIAAPDPFLNAHRGVVRGSASLDPMCRVVINRFLYKRREFIAMLGAAAAAWPIQSMSVMGFVSTRSADDSAYLTEAFHRGLAGSGYVESQNLTVECRWADGQYAAAPQGSRILSSRPRRIG
jgi:hypothetical protein